MNFFKSFTKPLMMLSAALLLVALAAGCHGRDPILGSGLSDLVSLAVTPATATIPLTGTQQFTATATFSDGSSHNVTTTSSWISGTPGNATVGPATGFATGVASGTSLITATFGGKSGSATLTVNAATSVSFAVTPTTASIPVSGTQQFAAIQIFSDGTTQDRTATSVWSTSGASAANASVGAATGRALGITVTPAGVPVVINATFGALVATPAALTVNAATSVSFVVTPATASIPVSGTQQFAAIQTFSDGTTQDRTTTSVWSTSGASAANASVGAATGRALGITVTPAVAPVVINATSGALVATPAALTVNAATSVSFVVTPAAASIPVSGNQQFAAIQTFSNGTTQDRTTTSVWSTSGTSAANASVGAATGRALGITATPTGVPVVINATFVALVATPANLTVNAATVVSINVTPAAATIPVNGTQQYTATAIFSDGSSLNVTTNSGTVWNIPGFIVGAGAVPTWSANGIAGAGVATGNSVGQWDITATYTVASIPTTSPTGTAILTVTGTPPPPPSPLASASTYGLIAASAMTISTIPQTHIYGDVALTNNDGFVGFAFGGTIPLPTSPYVTPQTIPGINSTVRGSVAAAAQAKIDLAAAYGDLSSRVPTTTYPAGAKQLSGLVLSPGVYRVGAAAAADTFALDNTLGPLVLDALGNPDAIFVLQASDITTTTGSVLLQGGAKPNNVYWVMTATATIGNGSGTVFQGTVVAGLAITVNGANVEGRMLAGASGIGALTIGAAGSVITVPVP